MKTFKHLDLHMDAEQVLWLTLDVADEKSNVLNPAVLTELSHACTAIRARNPRGLIICSAKPSNFIAGADIKCFTTMNTSEQALAFIQQGQQLCQQIADLPCPTVALVHGFCLGGGMEVALATDYRIASNNVATRLGLPEVKLGIHPGFGGTVRAIETMGVINAMSIMLSGRLLRAHTAKKLGLIDLCVPERQLRNSARHLIAHPPRKKPPAWYLHTLQRFRLSRTLLAKQLRKQVAEHARPQHYPAPYALIDLWEEHGNQALDMYQAEAKSVARLAITSSSQNLVRAFFLQNKLKALGNKQDFQARHIHVIGGGTMGGDIAAWCALQGMQVSVQDNNPDALARVIARAKQGFQKRYKRDQHAIRDALDRLIPDPQGHGVCKADVIIEAIFENLAAKQQLFQHIEQHAPAQCILASNTSSIPLADIAQGMQQPQRLIGLHFFNPVFKMPLVEVVYETDQYNPAILKNAQAFTRHIDKLPLPVKSAPGFLVNRILVPYLLAGIDLQQQNIPITVIDEAARNFGMPMGPLELADTVGLDICQHVGEILAQKSDKSVPKYLDTLVQANKLGKKTGEGFYRYHKGKLQPPKQQQWRGNKQVLQEKLIQPMLQEAENCLRQGIVNNADLLDAGVIFGTGFAPFRGGPLHYTRANSTNMNI